MDRPGLARQLSRLSITGYIHEQTPLCVLIEIADAHGIRYEVKDPSKPNFSFHLVESIHKTPVPKINKIQDEAEWQYVARFVNKNVQWPQRKLLQAYNFLIQFMNKEDPLTQIPSGFLAGAQTPDNPLALNACVLYKTCLHHRLHVNQHTTIQQMAYAVKMLSEPSEALVRRAQYFLEREARRVDLINVLMLSTYEIKDPGIAASSIDSGLALDSVLIDPNLVPRVGTTHDTMERMHQYLHNIKVLQEKIDPGTEAGAIALAALNYGLDITRAILPLREYRILKINGRNEYEPVDPWLKHWYQKNPSRFDLTVSFNPAFPAEYYDPNHLVGMAHREGYTQAEINSTPPYELLQLAYVSETFYVGELPLLKSRQTAIGLEDLDEIPYGALFCYGQMDTQMQLITVSELIGLFQANQNFTNPFQANAVFSATSLQKLRILLQDPTGPIPSIQLSSEVIRIRRQLLEIINQIEASLQNFDLPTRDFSLTYRSASPEIKIGIRKALTELLHAGMYMRGWVGGTQDYPVIRAPVPPERQLEVDRNVTETLAQFDQACRTLGHIGGQIGNLPLVNYKDGEYQPSTSETNGRTIRDRIEIIKQGETTRNVASCIRLSSNWICASAHKYMVAIGLPPPFDIFNLRYIS